MAQFDKISINGVPYNVHDTGTANALSELETTVTQQGEQITQQGATIQQQGETIQQQGETIQQQGQTLIEHETQLENHADEIGQINQDIEQLQQDASNITGFITPQLFGAKADGSTNDTTAIQNALNAAQANKIGVYFPSGQYLTGALTVPAGVYIKGDPSFQADRTKGTWILPNQTAQPTFTLNSGAFMDGFSFYYPGQTYNTQPVKYAAAIAVANESTRVNIWNILFYNAYDGINADNHHESLTINNIHGYCINTVIYAGDCSDVDRITNVQANVNMLVATGYPNAQQYRLWTRANGVAFRFGQGDWPCFTDMFCWGYRHAFYLEPTNYRGKGYSGMSGAHFVKCGADGCGTCFVSVAASGQSFTNHWGIQLDDCFFCNMNSDNPGQDVQFAILCQACDDITINNCRFWGCERTCICLECKYAEINNCVFWEYGTKDPNLNYSAIEVHTGPVNIHNCLFRARNQPLSGVNIVENCDGVTVTACTFTQFGGNSWMVYNQEDVTQLYVCDNILQQCDNSRMYTGNAPQGFGVIDKENVRHMINLTTQDSL